MSAASNLKCVVVSLFSLVLSFSLPSLRADTLIFSSSAKQTALLELYTSEGCSSCPPADRWLSNLRNDTKLWQDFIPVAFHVDYWDYIGWKDRFASPAYSQRQRQYAHEQSLRTVYTPGFILNGKEWRKRSANNLSNSSKSESPGRFIMAMEQNQASLEFQPAEIPGKKLQVNLALLGFDLKTQVKAGENEGRNLPHDFVVLGMKRARLKLNETSYSAQMKLPTSEISADRYAVVAWVSYADSQRPLQAVGGWLP